MGVLFRLFRLSLKTNKFDQSNFESYKKLDIVNLDISFHISQNGSEIELKYWVSSKTSAKLSRKYFVHLNWIRLATNPNSLDSSIGRAAV